jgi:hypothetical protein
MAYHIIGRIYAERWAPEGTEEVGDFEVLDIHALSDTPYCEAEEDLRWSIFSDTDIPKEPGVYVLMYVASLHPYQDYWGEHDVDIEIEWQKVKRLNEKQAKAVIDEVQGVEESFEDLLKETGQGDMICLK